MIYTFSYIDLNNPIYIYSYVYMALALPVIFVLQSQYTFDFIKNY